MMDKIEAIGAAIHQANEAEKRAAFRPVKTNAELEAENERLKEENATAMQTLQVLYDTFPNVKEAVDAAKALGEE